MKKIAVIITTLSFLLSDLSFAQNGGMNLAPPITLDDIAEGTPHEKNLVLAEMALLMDLQAMDGLREIDNTENVEDIKAAFRKLELLREEPYQRNPNYKPDNITVFFNLVEHVAGRVFSVPVSVNKYEKHYRLLFSTVRVEKGTFPAVLCTAEQLDKVRAEIVRRGDLPRLSEKDARAGERYRKNNEEIIDPWIERKMLNPDDYVEIEPGTVLHDAFMKIVFNPWTAGYIDEAFHYKLSDMTKKKRIVLIKVRRSEKRPVIYEKGQPVEVTEHTSNKGIYIFIDEEGRTEFDEKTKIFESFKNYLYTGRVTDYTGTIGADSAMDHMKAIAIADLTIIPNLLHSLGAAAGLPWDVVFDGKGKYRIINELDSIYKEANLHKGRERVLDMPSIAKLREKFGDVDLDHLTGTNAAGEKYERDYASGEAGAAQELNGSLFKIPKELLGAYSFKKTKEANHIIGVPKEIKPQAERVGLTPDGVKFLTKLGVKVIVEKGAGRQHFSDEAYKKAGAEMVDTAEEVWMRATIVKKVKEPLGPEFELMRPGQIVFTYLHLASPELKELTKKLVEKKVTGIAYETIITEENGKKVTPVLRPMSIIAGDKGGYDAIAYTLESYISGSGKNKIVFLTPRGKDMINRVKTTYPDSPMFSGLMRGKEAAILGGGVSGERMAKRLLEAGASVTIADINDARLEELKEIFKEHGGRLTLLNPGLNINKPSAELIEKYKTADILGGCILLPGGKAPKMSKKLLAQISKGKPKTIIDIALDQGGNFYGSYSRHYDDPVFIDEFGNKRFCVSNIPDAVGKVASIELEKANIAYTLALAMGLSEAVKIFPELEGGMNTYDGKLVNAAVAKAYPRLPTSLARQELKLQPVVRTTPPKPATNMARDAEEGEGTAAPNKIKDVKLLKRIKDLIFRYELATSSLRRNEIYGDEQAIQKSKRQIKRIERKFQRLIETSDINTLLRISNELKLEIFRVKQSYHGFDREPSDDVAILEHFVKLLETIISLSEKPVPTPAKAKTRRDKPATNMARPEDEGGELRQAADSAKYVSIDEMPWNFTREEIPQQIASVAEAMLRLDKQFKGIVVLLPDGSKRTVMLDESLSLPERLKKALPQIEEAVELYSPDMQFKFFWVGTPEFSGLGIVPARTAINTLDFGQTRRELPAPEVSGTQAGRGSEGQAHVSQDRRAYGTLGTKDGSSPEAAMAVLALADWQSREKPFTLKGYLEFYKTVRKNYRELGLRDIKPAAARADLNALAMQGILQINKPEKGNAAYTFEVSRAGGQLGRLSGLGEKIKSLVRSYRHPAPSAGKGDNILTLKIGLDYKIVLIDKWNVEKISGLTSLGYNELRWTPGIGKRGAREINEALASSRLSPEYEIGDDWVAEALHEFLDTVIRQRIDFEHPHVPREIERYLTPLEAPAEHHRISTIFTGVRKELEAKGRISAQALPLYKSAAIIWGAYESVLNNPGIAELINRGNEKNAGISVLNALLAELEIRYGLDKRHVKNCYAGRSTARMKTAPSPGSLIGAYDFLAKGILFEELRYKPRAEGLARIVLEGFIENQKMVFNKRSGEFNREVFRGEMIGALERVSNDEIDDALNALRDIAITDVDDPVADYLISMMKEKRAGRDPALVKAGDMSGATLASALGAYQPLALAKLEQIFGNEKSNEWPRTLATNVLFAFCEAQRSHLAGETTSFGETVLTEFETDAFGMLERAGPEKADAIAMAERALGAANGIALTGVSDALVDRLHEAMRKKLGSLQKEAVQANALDEEAIELLRQSQAALPGKYNEVGLNLATFREDTEEAFWNEMSRVRIRINDLSSFRRYLTHIFKKIFKSEDVGFAASRRNVSAGGREVYGENFVGKMTFALWSRNEKKPGQLDIGIVMRKRGGEIFDIEIHLTQGKDLLERGLEDYTITVRLPSAEARLETIRGIMQMAADLRSGAAPGWIRETISSNTIDLSKMDEHSAIIFSKGLTFKHRLGALLPRLAKSGMRVAVVAASDREIELIRELNKGKPDNEKIGFGSSIEAVKSKVKAARYYYFRAPDELKEAGVTDVVMTVEQILRIIGRICGFKERSKEMEDFNAAMELFGQAA